MFGAAAAITAVIGGGGFAAGTGTAEPGQAASPPATTVSPSRAARSGYADVVRAVLPSVVLIRTDSGLGSGVVLDGDGNIVTNAHVAGNATAFRSSWPATRSRGRRGWSAATRRVIWR